MKINYSKAYQALSNGEKLPRKVKKAFLGLRMSKSKLKRLLKTVEIVSTASTMYEAPEIKPYTFCPHCGCTLMRGTGNKASYPEHWEYFYCSRCNKVVGYIDNSPFIHALECSDNGYDPVF